MLFYETFTFKEGNKIVFFLAKKTFFEKNKRGLGGHFEHTKKFVKMLPKLRYDSYITFLTRNS